MSTKQVQSDNSGIKIDPKCNSSSNCGPYVNKQICKECKRIGRITRSQLCLSCDPRERYDTIRMEFTD